jgi:antitoxin ParD1/3/4
MDVQLKPELEKFIHQQVEQGRDDSAEDAVNAAVAQLQTGTELSPDDIAELRAEIDMGIAEADRGEFVEFTAEDIIAERRAALESRKKGC